MGTKTLGEEAKNAALGAKLGAGAEEFRMDSRQQPPWHVAVLGFFTCNLYLGYWAFKTFADLKRESIEVNGAVEDLDAKAAGIQAPTLKPVPERKRNLRFDDSTREALRTFSRVNPALRALGMMIPVVQVFLTAILTIGISALVPDEKSFPRRKTIEFTLIICAGFLGALCLSYLPHAFFLLANLAMVPIAVLQHFLNIYWRTVEVDDLLVRAGFNLWEMLAIIAGALLMGGVIAGYMMGVKL